jgi:hypothetical protein
MFAFSPDTDPPKVVRALAWAWAGGDPYHNLPPGQNLCFGPCPFLEGGYCLDCHGVAYAALVAVRRYEAWKQWLVTGRAGLHE